MPTIQAVEQLGQPWTSVSKNDISVCQQAPSEFELTNVKSERLQRTPEQANQTTL